MANTKKVVLAYAYGTTNAGDHALTLGALRLLKRADAEFDITVISRYPPACEPSEATRDINKKFPEVKTVPSPFRFTRRNALSRFLEKVHGGMVFGANLVSPYFTKYAFRNDASLNEIFKADLVLCNGGNLFYWNHHRKSLPRLLALSFPIRLANRMGKKYALLPQTMGPFEGVLPKFLFKGLFEGAKFIQFREPISKENASDVMDLSSTRTSVVPDLAFVPADLNESKKEAGDTAHLDSSNRSQDFIAVTLRASQLGDPELAKGDSVNNDSVEGTANYMLDVVGPVAERHGLGIQAVVQTDVDRSVSQRFVELCHTKLSCPVNLVENRDSERLSTFYSGAALLVGMRLHSIIFALRCNTPVVGIYKKRFGPKIEGTLNMFGLEKYSLLQSKTEKRKAQSVVKEVYTKRGVISDRVGYKKSELLEDMENEVSKAIY